MNETKAVNSEELWKQHVELLRYVDIIENKALRQVIKTKVLDVAHVAKESLETLEGGH
ncbi:hypothetical protein vBBak6_031 [Bacillus phage v_B-Bak6]|uniref:Uncharacterized protein n=2 Tax=Basiliskvirus TaxID=3044670 RepID=A0A385IKB2_9CAUD|nr:hypothetical protein PP653_gp128 [Bacillus phage Basilisk]YP_010656943.1 hypothetical protein PP654_gp106 [Bacillus phage v_B-Bak10]AXY82991.1 hypothetical protein vBBak1_031 [Bacillus phage v_B-Bak1]AXY83111.1 hypothetical protein vBBak6_031 [Bacillus phage v_B-Bak6]HDV4620969.1 hypothetical protein [Bacillus anthracis]AGR46584.1 hypothetical protein BASILISK_39 [Bacillus phage Basilisk]AXY83300.1 hypothetical protein vBBBak10_036 [Bacillus phage v_B-Bak10]